MTNVRSESNNTGTKHGIRKHDIRKEGAMQEHGVKTVTGIIEVNIRPQKEFGFEKIASRICGYPEVSDVCLMSGDYDLLVVMEDQDMYDISMFVTEKLSRIEGVAGCSTHFILKKYKGDGTINTGVWEDARDQREAVSA